MFRARRDRPAGRALLLSDFGRLAPDHAAVRAALDAFRARQTQDVLDHADPRQP